jgi:hypothetical protein
MFGAFIRAAPEIGIAVLLGAILRFILPLLLPLMGPDDGYVATAFTGISENAVFIMLVAIAAGLLARAVAESNAGVR